MNKSFDVEFFVKNGKVYVNGSVVEFKKVRNIYGSLNKPEVQEFLEEFNLSSRYANEVEWGWIIKESNIS